MSQARTWSRYVSELRGSPSLSFSPVQSTDSGVAPDAEALVIDHDMPVFVVMLVSHLKVHNQQHLLQDRRNFATDDTYLFRWIWTVTHPELV